LNNKKSLSLAQRQARNGIFFSLPLIIGFVLFILAPIVHSVIYSFSEIKSSDTGMAVNFVGFANYHRALFVDPDFVKSVYGSVTQMLLDFPLIIFYSFFIASILNQKFKGRAIARTLFFLPVIITSGVILTLQNDPILGAAANMVKGGNSDGTDTIQLTKLFTENIEILKLSPSLITYITSGVDKIYQITTQSGVQILIFLAGLQTISPSLFEASSIEGATSWENFWKITFPMISPLILVNSVYTIIDSMSGLNNSVISNLFKVAFKDTEYGYSAAMSWIYFSVIFIALGIVIYFVSRKVYYEN